MNDSVVKFYRDSNPLIKKDNLKKEFVSPQWKRMEVILKVTERCNIDCTYCYFFNSTNKDFEDHPVYINYETIKEVIAFLENAVKEANVKYLQIDFHGGEPLLMKKQRFDEMCSLFKDQLGRYVDLRFVIQTNAMLIDQEWLSIFKKHEISIGISLDGPKKIHDENRVDHQGRGTYDQTIAGWNLVRESNIKGLKDSSGIICVIDPDHDARTVFNHFVDDLDFTSINYLLPMEDHDTFDEEKYKNMTKYLCDLFDAWIERGNKKIQIRYFYRFLSRLTGGESTRVMVEKMIGDNLAFTIASNGDIGSADDLRNTFPKLFRTKSNAANTRLADFVNIPSISSHNVAVQERHEDCLKCCWGKICDGGDIVGSEAFRYSRANGFRNKSVYCSSIEGLLTHMTEFLLKNGVAFEEISRILISE